MSLRSVFRWPANLKNRFFPKEILTIQGVPEASLCSSVVLRVPEKTANLFRCVGQVWATCLDGNAAFPPALRALAEKHLESDSSSLLSNPGPNAHALEIRVPHNSPTPDGFADFSIPTLRQIARLHEESLPHLMHIDQKVESAVRYFDQVVRLVPLDAVHPVPEGRVMISKGTNMTAVSKATHRSSDTYTPMCN